MTWKGAETFGYLEKVGALIYWGCQQDLLVRLLLYKRGCKVLFAFMHHEKSARLLITPLLIIRTQFYFLAQPWLPGS